MTKTRPTHSLKPGDLVCGTCGEGNVPTRKFCARCGSSLVEAARVETPWRRKFTLRRGPKVVPLAKGTGPAGSGARIHDRGFKPLMLRIYRRARMAVAVCVLAGGALYGAYPPLRIAVNHRVTAIKQEILNAADQTLAPIHAVRVDADVQAPGHPPLLAADELTNTYWLAPWTASPAPQLVLTFSHPVTLKKLILHSGASDAYVAHGRPSSLRLVFSNHESFTITPQDTSKPQTFDVQHAVLVTSVQIQVTAIYQGSGSPDVAVSEIELFGIQ